MKQQQNVISISLLCVCVCGFESWIFAFVFHFAIFDAWFVCAHELGTHNSSSEMKKIQFIVCVKYNVLPDGRAVEGECTGFDGQMIFYQISKQINVFRTNEY